MWGDCVEEGEVCGIGVGEVRDYGGQYKVWGGSLGSLWGHVGEKALAIIVSKSTALINPCSSSRNCKFGQSTDHQMALAELREYISSRGVWLMSPKEPIFFNRGRLIYIEP